MLTDIAVALQPIGTLVSIDLLVDVLDPAVGPLRLCLYGQAGVSLSQLQAFADRRHGRVHRDAGLELIDLGRIIPAPRDGQRRTGCRDVLQPHRVARLHRVLVEIGGFSEMSLILGLSRLGHQAAGHSGYVGSWCGYSYRWSCHRRSSSGLNLRGPQKPEQEGYG